MPRPVLLLLAVLVLPLLATARAESPLVTRGGEIAAARCGKCHATHAKGDSPHRAAVPFRELSERFPIDMLRDAARTGTLSGHDEMPQFDFTAEEVRALLALIDSLSPEGRRYRDAK